MLNLLILVAVLTLISLIVINFYMVLLTNICGISHVLVENKIKKMDTPAEDVVFSSFFVRLAIYFGGLFA